MRQYVKYTHNTTGEIQRGYFETLAKRNIHEAANSAALADFTASDDLESKKQAEIAQCSKARFFCSGIIDTVAQINEGLNDPQLMQAIFTSSNYQAIILALLTGATKTARGLIAAHGPGLYTQQQVDDIVASMDVFIAAQEPEAEPEPEEPEP